MVLNPSPSSETLDPLPRVLQRGLLAVSCLGLLSFLSCLNLFLYLSYKLLRWWRRGQLEDGCNQFLLLIYNLVLADMQQAVAFLLALVWISENKIDTTATACWVQGWFVSTGDLSSGVWIFAIALHTFYAVVKGRRLQTAVFLSSIAGLWIFVYSMAIIGVIMHPDDFYVRAGAWCWINEKYAAERLWLHYFYIFIAMFGTIIMYAIIVVTLRSRIHIGSLDSNSSLAPLSTGRNDTGILRRAGRYMVLYPATYTVCTLPLAAGRMAAMTGIDVSYWYYCLAGAAITSCGWLDVSLYAFTRHVLVFSDKPPAVEDCSVDTFGVINLSDNLFGNQVIDNRRGIVTTTIEGGLGTPPIRGHRDYGGILSTLHHGRRTPSSAQPRDDLFATPVAGVITTKTTIEITSRPVTQDRPAEQALWTSESTATSRTDSGKTLEVSRSTSYTGSWNSGTHPMQQEALDGGERRMWNPSLSFANL